MKNFFKNYSIHILLFLVTLCTTTVAGAEWMYGKFLLYGDSLSIHEILNGFQYSAAFLGILTAHEFGHFFMAKFHRVQVSLPYYLPQYFGFLPGGISIGTFGAFIRIREKIESRKVFFDIGIAGPLAGFVVALTVLFYGFTNLPPAEHIYEIHPEYKEFGLNYADSVYQPADNIMLIKLGSNLTFDFFKNYVAPSPELVPNQFEIIHYPWIFAGYLALFFTALNLIPIGQLDGGHILYGLIGTKKHKVVSSLLFVIFVFYAGLGLPFLDPFNHETSANDLSIGIPIYLGFLYLTFSRMGRHFQERLLLALAVFAVQYLLAYLYPLLQGYTGWLLFAFIIGRFLGVYHPPALYDEPLDPKRKILGWIALVVFIISFSPSPFNIIE